MAKDDTNDMAAVLSLLIDKIAAMKESGAGITTEQLELLLQKTAGNTAEAFRSALIPENKVHPNPVSVYTYPEGEAARPKPKLLKETWFCGYTQRDDNLTPQEIDALNALTEGGPFEARGGMWKAWLAKSGTKETLMVYCDEAADRDRARDLPPLTAICYELKRGPAAVDLVELTAQLEAMRTKLNQVTAGVPA